MKDNTPGKADYILAVMQQIVDKVAEDNEITEDEKDELTRLNEETVKSKYMTSREWEMLV